MDNITTWYQSYVTVFNDAKELNKALAIPIVQKTYFMNCLVRLPSL